MSDTKQQIQALIDEADDDVQKIFQQVFIKERDYMKSSITQARAVDEITAVIKSVIKKEGK